MKLVYDQEYYDDYYNGPYDETFHYGFHLDDILISCWDNIYKDRPKSFADIGSGPGQTLRIAEQVIPGADPLYGVECQEIPQDKIVHKNVIIGDFLEISKKLEPVDLLYCACSMYIDWCNQPYFIEEILRLSKKAVCFANVYLSDRRGIPADSQRCVIYRSRQTFAEGIESFGGWKSMPGLYDFFYSTS
jgi:hypothetical protein